MSAAGRRLLLAAAVCAPLAFAACGGSGTGGTTTASRPASDGPAGLAGASARTIAAGSARFRLAVSGDVAGLSTGSEERGTISFGRRIARLYRLVPGNGVPQELVVIDPIVYTNANVVAALSDSAIRPWTRVDTRRLPSAGKEGPDDIDHVRALAYLSDGVADPRRVAPPSGGAPALTHFRGLVEPTRVLAHVPGPERRAMRAVLGADYAARAFPADFWLDRRGRVVRVQVVYRTSGGGRIRIAGAFTGFGSKVDLRLPPAAKIQDLTP